ncbi:glycosyltransferase family 29 protein, partial [Thioclava sp. UBA3469]|uniref:glycosyltransferase family 29 protein n=1 Tax=Thioclava sp. UBA3469 TaxID=1947693 RepID=UPI00257949C9
MTRLGFLINRTLRREAPLAALSVSQKALLGDLAGKSVALVGNARALAEGQAGAAIDAHDVVIRINRAPMPSAESHGTRTDWLA